MNPHSYLDDKTVDLLLFMENEKSIYAYIKETQIDLLIHRAKGTYSRVLAKHLFYSVMVQGFNSYNRQIGRIELNRQQSNELALYLVYSFEGTPTTDMMNDEDLSRFPMTFTKEVH